MRLYEKFGARGFHTSIATTFGVDFSTYENVALPRLRGASCNNNILLVDRGMLALALSDTAALPRSAGRWYTATGTTAAAVFHPKILLQLGRDRGRLIVSSANMTASGLAGNLELAGEVECQEGDSGEQRLIAQAWRFVTSLMATAGTGVATQIAWALQRAPWLRRAIDTAGVVQLADDTLAGFFTSGSSPGIGEQFLKQIDGDKIRSLVVISPYWDTDLRALKSVITRLSPGRLDAIVDIKARSFPPGVGKKIKGLRIISAAEIAGGRFLHAKALIARSKQWDHILFGSANCTVAALGVGAASGVNHEACLYRRLPSGSLMAALDLDMALTDAPAVDLDSLPEVEYADSLDLDTWNAKYPGRFEWLGRTLIWTPAEGVSGAVSLQLLSETGKDLGGERKLVAAGTALHLDIPELSEIPAFARVHFADGTFSSLAIVVVIDSLRSEAREHRSRRIDGVIAQISEETEEGLWMLDAFDVIERAEDVADDQGAPVTIARKPGKKKAQDQVIYRTLTYDQFIAMRKNLSYHGGVAHTSSLASSDLTLLRAFLNRTLGLQTSEMHFNQEENEAAILAAMDLGDETADAAALISGAISGTAVPNGYSVQADPAKVVKRKASRAQLTAAATKFAQRLLERRTLGLLTPNDIFRLRALLTIELAAGWPGRDGDAGARTMIQVLPVEGSDETWPKIVGRTLFAFFGGGDPPISHVRIAAQHENLTDDILEAWATCYWAVHAAALAPYSEPERVRIAKYLDNLSGRIYLATGLAPSELNSGTVVATIDQLGKRFGPRLGVTPEEIIKRHVAFVELSGTPGGLAPMQHWRPTPARSKGKRKIWRN